MRSKEMTQKMSRLSSRVQVLIEMFLAVEQPSAGLHMLTV